MKLKVYKVIKYKVQMTFNFVLSAFNLRGLRRRRA